MSNNQAQPQELKRQLGLGKCLILSIGGCLGVGIFAYTGTGIYYAGVSTPLAFLIAGILAMYLYVPSMYLGSAIPATGGSYMYVSRFVHPFAGFLQILCSLIGALNIAVFAMTFAAYFAAIVPSANSTLVAIAVLVLLSVVGTFGAKASTSMQNIVVICTLLALAVFVFFGFGSIKAEYISLEQVLDSDLIGMLAAVAILRYTLQGSAVVMSLGDEVENPTRNIPLAFFLGTGIVTLIYVVVSIVAVGVAPVSESALQPLSFQAAVFLDGPLFTFFVVAGGLLATLMSINTGLLNYSRMHWVAARDGIWPEVFKKLNKNQVPAVILWTITAVASVVIVLNVPVSTVISLVTLPTMILAFLFYLPPMVMAAKLPYCAANATMKLPKIVINFVSITCIFIMLYLSRSIFLNISTTSIISLVTFFVIGSIYWFARTSFLKKNKGIDMVANMKGYHPFWLEREEQYRKAAEEAAAKGV